MFVHNRNVDPNAKNTFGKIMKTRLFFICCNNYIASLAQHLFKIIPAQVFVRTEL